MLGRGGCPHPPLREPLLVNLNASGPLRKARLARERLDRSRFVVFHVKHGVKLGDLQQVVDLLGKVQKLQFATLVADRGEGADQLADTRAVNVIDVAEVEQNLLLSFGKQVADGIAQDHATFPEGNAAAAIDDGHTIDLPRTGLHRHWEASLAPAAEPWTCLISLISVPVWDG